MTLPDCRLLPFGAADGPHNMAADEVLLESAAAGIASLRFYVWEPATLSLGYFQPERLHRDDPQLARLPWVRRPSGGATLVHHHEVTYALAVPAGLTWQTTVPWPRRMHALIVTALTKLGVAARLHEAVAELPTSDTLCFHHFTAGDVLIGNAKIVGSAQRRQRGALMQHGGILLARSPHTPSLPGIRELAGVALSNAQWCAALGEVFFGQTGWQRGVPDWTEAEHRRIEELAAGKYAQDWWNLKR